MKIQRIQRTSALHVVGLLVVGLSSFASCGIECAAFVLHPSPSRRQMQHPLFIKTPISDPDSPSSPTGRNEEQGEEEVPITKIIIDELQHHESISHMLPSNDGEDLKSHSAAVDTNTSESTTTHHDDNHDESLSSSDIVYNIDNEISLAEFISVIRRVDKGILLDENDDSDTFDLAMAWDILFEKSLDTIEDANLMFRRKMSESDAVLHPKSADVLADWKTSNKPRVLVIGSGWGAHAFIKCIDTDAFNVLVISPTNHFVFTPMLASSSVGTTEMKSIVESTRDSNPFVTFLEGRGIDVNFEQCTLRVKLGQGDELSNDVGDGDGVGDGDDEKKKRKDTIDIPYDIAIYAAGVGPILSSKRTIGLCKDNVYFLKSIQDASRLRTGVIDLLERASQPGYTHEERSRLLTFVVVGGGPTGVEYCGELADFLNDVTGGGINIRSRTGSSEGRRRGRGRVVAPFASLARYTRVILLQSAPDVLPMFEDHLRQSARLSLESQGVEVLTDTRVVRIEGRDKIVIHRSSRSIGGDQGEGEGGEQDLECGLIVWAAGTKPIPLTEKLISNIENVLSDKEGIDGSSLSSSSSSSSSSLQQLPGIGGRVAVDRWQRVIGAPAGSMFAIGDASATVLGLGEKDTRPLPQTAQVAAQQGAYLARLLNRGYDLKGMKKSSKADDAVDAAEEEEEDDRLFLGPPIHHGARKGDATERFKLRGRVTAKPFKFLNLGQLAYTGGGEALSQVQIGDNKIFSKAGSVGFLLWKSVYIVKQVSTKTRLLVLFDWFKTKVFGRDITRN